MNAPFAAQAGSSHRGVINLLLLTDLAVRRRVTASTQNQALNALVFLYREVLHQDAGDFAAVRAKRPARLPTVLTAAEVHRLFSAMKPGTHRLMARLLYGTGMRLMECVRLRVKDLLFEQNQIIVREGKGNKDRMTMLPATLKAELEEHLQRVKLLHERDLAAGFGEVYLPYALAMKYHNAAWEWGWQYVFPAAALSHDPRSGRQRRHHASETGLQRAVKEGVRLARSILGFRFGFWIEEGTTKHTNYTKRIVNRECTLMNAKECRRSAFVIFVFFAGNRGMSTHLAQLSQTFIRTFNVRLKSSSTSRTAIVSRSLLFDRCVLCG